MGGSLSSMILMTCQEKGGKKSGIVDGDRPGWG